MCYSDEDTEDEERIKEQLERMKRSQAEVDNELGSIRDMLAQLREKNSVKEAQVRAVLEAEVEAKIGSQVEAVDQEAKADKSMKSEM